MRLGRPELIVLISAALSALGACASSETSTAEGMVNSVASSLITQLEAGINAIQHAAGSLPPTAQIVYASERCASSGSGGPDCGEAAARVCKTKGFSSGKPVDVASANACRLNSSPALRPGVVATCRTKYELTASLCW